MYKKVFVKENEKNFNEEKEKNVKKAFLWNMIGSTCYSGSSFLSPL